MNLNWKEKDLPESLRTKHVHRLHPYLGKFVPQLAEIFLRKYAPKHVTDPFCGSGTTLVEANALRIGSFGSDICSFNCLLSRVKTQEYDVVAIRKEIKDILNKLKGKKATRPLFDDVPDTESEYLKKWFAPKARKQLLYFKSLIPHYEYQDLLKVILSRSARSARLTTHYDLDFPKEPQVVPYYCYKHRRTCKPTEDALQFIRRYCLDSLDRIQEYSAIRTKADVRVVCGDSRIIQFPETEMMLTSPPYVGLIDYHQQHAYAYELLDLERKDEEEIGAAFKGASKTAQDNYCKGISQVFSNVHNSMTVDGIAAIVVNDRYSLFEVILEKSGFTAETEIMRQVNRRTGRRANDFYEKILVWRKR